MSLRSVGNQLLQTAPSSLLAGASTASLSLWVCVNPGSNVANANGVEIFGDSGGKLSATLSGTGNLQLRWSSIAGNSGGSSSWALALAPGTAYHLAAVWQSGTQQYFLNGVQVHADTQVGSIGVPGDTASHPYRLGSDSAGTDVSLGDPTLWVGYALTAQDVLNLRDRAVQPSAVAPPSIVLRWSLSGPAGAAAQVGDPGLADASPTGLNLSSVVGSAPAYQAALTYVAPPPVARALVAPSGQAIVIRPVDDSGQFVTLSSIGSPDDVQTVTFPGVIAAGNLTLAFSGQATSAIPFTVTQPTEAGTWTVPTVAGNPIKVAYSVPPYDPTPYHSVVLWEVIDGGVVTAAFTQDQARINLSADFTLSNIAGGSGDCSFKVIFPSYTPAGSSIAIRMSFPPGTFRLIADALYVEDLATTTVIVYDDADAAHFTALAADTTYGAGSTGPQYAGTEHIWNFGGQQAGTTVQVDPAAVQSALEALPDIGAGNVSVAAAPGGVAITFAGAMAAVARPSITTTTPGVSIAHAPGGNVPVATITPQGGSPGSPIPFNGLNGGLLTVVGGRTWVHYALPTGVTIAPTDSVSVTIPANWMVTAAGTLQAGTYAATNLVGGTFLPPFDPSPKTMALGYNVMPDTYFSNTLMFSNMAGRMGSQDDYGHVVALDPDGYPTLITNAATSNIVTQPDPNPNGNGKGTLNAPNGLYTFIFDDVNETTPVLGGNNTSFAEIAAYRNASGPTNRVFVFNVQANQAVQFAPWIYWSWVASSGPDANGHYACTMKNLRIYPPDPSDPTGMTPWGLDPANPPPKFHPEFVRMVRGAKSLRFMKCLGGADNSLADFADIKPITHIDRSSQQVAAHAFPILSSTAYTGSAVHDDPTFVLVEVTTATPHGLWNGAKLINVNIGTVTLSDGRTFDSAGGYGVATVLDATHFVWHAFQETTPGLSMVGTNTGGSFDYGKGTQLPIEDCVDLCNEVGADCWLNLPAPATPACARAVGQLVGGRLDPGLEVRIELGNECWDYYNFSFAWLRAVAYASYGETDRSYTSAYAALQGAVHDAFQAGLTAAGWTGTLVRTFSTVGAAPGATSAILAYARANGIPVDEVAIAPYFNSLGFGSFTPYLGWSAGLCLDVLELDEADPGFSFTQGTLDAISAAYPTGTPKLVAYESGPESLVPGLNLGNSGNFPTATALYTIQQDIHRHPRFYRIMLQALQNLQDQDMTLIHDFYVNGPGQWETYATYEWYAQADGTGSMTTDSLNASAPQATDAVKSQEGGAIHHWQSLFGAAGSKLAAGLATAGSTTGTTASATATEATGATGTIAHQWYRSMVSGQAGSPVSGQTTLTLADTGLTPGTTYYYQLQYADNTGSVYSNQVTLTTAAVPLKAGTATAGTATATTATAAAAEATGGTAPYAHQWYRSQAAGHAGSPVAGQTTLHLSDTGLKPGTTYYYEITYTDAAGSSVSSNQAAIATASVGTTSKAKPYVTKAHGENHTGQPARAS